MTGKLDINFVLQLREALEAAWDKQTAYHFVEQVNNPALGQCYPTSRVIQHYFPQLVILQGIVWNGKSEDAHFWNALKVDQDWYHVDLTWQQFPAGSIVREFHILDPLDPPDSDVTKRRCALLLQRVENFLSDINKCRTPSPALRAPSPV